MVDVAKRAGVSIATVSRVLNKTKHVEAPIEEAVWKAIKELDFTPDQHARWLSSGRSNVVGIAMPSVENWVLSPFLHACTEELNARNFDVMVALTEDDKISERELIQTLVRSHVSAVIVVTRYVDAKIRQLLTRAGVPAVLAFNEDPNSRIPAVVFDDEEAARSLAEGVPENRRSRAILSQLGSEVSIARRISGFRKVSAEKWNMDIPVFECDGTIEGAYQVSRELLRRNRPEVLHTTSDYLAIAAIRAAYDLGLLVPRDVAITGFGENHYSQTATPSLTTVRIDGRDVGRLCGEGAISLLEKRTVPAVQKVGYSLVAGNSCPLRRQL